MRIVIQIRESIERNSQKQRKTGLGQYWCDPHVVTACLGTDNARNVTCHWHFPNDDFPMKEIQTFINNYRHSAKISITGKPESTITSLFKKTNSSKIWQLPCNVQRWSGRISHKRMECP